MEPYGSHPTIPVHGHQTLATRPSHAQGAPSEVAGANLVKLLRYARRGVRCPALWTGPYATTFESFFALSRPARVSP